MQIENVLHHDFLFQKEESIHTVVPYSSLPSMFSPQHIASGLMKTLLDPVPQIIWSSHMKIVQGKGALHPVPDLDLGMFACI